MIRGGLLDARRFGESHVIPRAALQSAVLRKTKPGPVPKAQTANGTPKGPAAANAKLNKAFCPAQEAEEAGKTSAKKNKKS